MGSFWGSFGKRAVYGGFWGETLGFGVTFWGLMFQFGDLGSNIGFLGGIGVNLCHFWGGKAQFGVVWGFFLGSGGFRGDFGVKLWGLGSHFGV